MVTPRTGVAAQLLLMSVEGHIARNCTNDPNCVNCGGNHTPSDRECAAYKLKSEIIATQAREHITFQEANERVRERFVEEGRP